MTTFIALILSLSFVSPSGKLDLGHKTNEFSFFSRQELRIVSDSSFTADNETTVNIGIVTIDLYDQSSTNLSVPGNGTFYANISSTPVLCVINGQSVVFNTPTRIMINSHTSVRATWSSTNYILVDDEETF